MIVAAEMMIMTKRSVRRRGVNSRGRRICHFVHFEEEEEVEWDSRRCLDLEEEEDEELILMWDDDGWDRGR